jgi:hypothetical protein
MEDIGYTIAISGRMKCARLSGRDTSSSDPCELEPPDVEVALPVGRNLERREKMDCWGGGGRLRIDFPGVGIVTADEEAEGDGQ